jgi:hypothetical protein
MVRLKFIEWVKSGKGSPNCPINFKVMPFELHYTLHLRFLFEDSLIVFAKLLSSFE